MGTSDGHVGELHKIVDNGANAERFNIVIMGDGYQAAEMDKFAANAQAFVTVFRATAPYTTLWPAINIFRLDVISTDSGVDDQGAGVNAHTYFDSGFESAIARLLTCDTDLAVSTAHAQVPQTHLALVIANTSEYGGSGGKAAVFSINASSAEIALHEMGHTAFKLADEYECYAGCSPPEAAQCHYEGGEPVEPNVTSSLWGGAIKWHAQLSAAGDALPTTVNADCSHCDGQANPRPAGYTGAFEGARYFHCGCYRPSFNCRMRTLGQPFCSVCQAVITAAMQPCLPAAPSV